MPFIQKLQFSLQMFDFFFLVSQLVPVRLTYVHLFLTRFSACPVLASDSQMSSYPDIVFKPLHLAACVAGTASTASSSKSR